MKALDAATAVVADQSRQRQVQAKEDAKRRALEEKEEEIAKRNLELEEAAEFNSRKEIGERMAALDQATAALLERANDVQHEIDRRTQSGGSDGSVGVVVGGQEGGNDWLGRVEPV